MNPHSHNSPKRCKEIVLYLKKCKNYDETCRHFGIKEQTLRRYITGFNYFYDDIVSCYDKESVRSRITSFTHPKATTIIKWYFDNKCNKEKTCKKFNIKSTTFDTYIQYFYHSSNE